MYMTINSDLLFYRKNGFLIKKNLFSKIFIKNLVDEINKLKKNKFEDDNYFEYKSVNKKNIL